MRLAGKVALITGGASGIGRCTARRFAAEGARVVIADRDRDAGAALAAELNAAGTETLFVPCDVTDEASVAAVIAATRERFGALHVLVTCAGILLATLQPVSEVEAETFRRVLDVNVTGTFLCCKHATPLLQETGDGVILCISSWAGVRGPSSTLPYGASKAAIYGFAWTLEEQLKPAGIRVNVVCPGSLDTPLKRQNVRDRALVEGVDPEQAVAETPLGDPDGVAKVLAFLASDEADYVIGTVFTR